MLARANECQEIYAVNWGCLIVCSHNSSYKWMAVGSDSAALVVVEAVLEQAGPSCSRSDGYNYVEQILLILSRFHYQDDRVVVAGTAGFFLPQRRPWGRESFSSRKYDEKFPIKF